MGQIQGSNQPLHTRYIRPPSFPFKSIPPISVYLSHTPKTDTSSPSSTGQRNQAELSRAIDPFLTHDPTRVSLHNQLVAAIYANAGREPPEPGVASWVSANDKPTTVAKAVAGDAAEQRLKAEVMALPARERRRLKAIADVRASLCYWCGVGGFWRGGGGGRACACACCVLTDGLVAGTVRHVCAEHVRVSQREGDQDPRHGAHVRWGLQQDQ